MNDKTLLLRQINPNFINADGVTSQAFRPTSKDDKKLSVYDGDQFSAQSSWIHFATEINCKSKGVLGLIVCECKINNLSVKRDDDLFQGHVTVDFSYYEKNEDIRRLSRELRRMAVQRGWLYKHNDCS